MKRNFKLMTNLNDEQSDAMLVTHLFANMSAEQAKEFIDREFSQQGQGLPSRDL